MITRLGNDAGMHEVETFLARAHLSAPDCSKGSTREVEDEREKIVPCLNHSHQKAFVSAVGLVYARNTLTQEPKPLGHGSVSTWTS